MDSEDVIWIVVAVIAALILLALVAALVKKASARKQEHHRARADELREQAAATDTGIRRHQAEADEADAHAREVRAEADRKLAEAKKLETEARDKKSTLHEHVERRDEVLREADDIDPDVTDDAKSGADGTGDRSGADHPTGHHRA